MIFWLLFDQAKSSVNYNKRKQNENENGNENEYGSEAPIYPLLIEQRDRKEGLAMLRYRLVSA